MRQYETSIEEFKLESCYESNYRASPDSLPRLSKSRNLDYTSERRERSHPLSSQYYLKYTILYAKSSSTDQN